MSGVSAGGGIVNDVIRGVQDTLFIGGRLRPAHSTARLPVINPATEETFAAIPDADEVDVGDAVSAARQAFRDSGWAQLAPAERAVYLRRLAELIEGRAEELGALVTAQNGMPLANSIAGNGVATGRYYRYFAGLADELEPETERSGQGSRTVVRQEPVGVAALIVPWNGPQGSIAWKLAPALAAGCTAVVKPAPETSLDSYILAELITQAGIPPGVVNIITGGREAGATLVAHPGIDKVAFTGSTVAGRKVALACAEGFKRVTLELGGKSAAVLLDDVDLDAFVPFVASACAPFSGQICRALTRVLAPRSRYDEVVEAVAGAMGELTVGDPLDPATRLGPLVSARQRGRVEDYIRSGQEEGAKVVIGGGRPAGFETGYYVEATVFRGVGNDILEAERPCDLIADYLRPSALGRRLHIKHRLPCSGVGLSGSRARESAWPGSLISVWVPVGNPGGGEPGQKASDGRPRVRPPPPGLVRRPSAGDDRALADNRNHSAHFTQIQNAILRFSGCASLRDGGSSLGARRSGRGGADRCKRRQPCGPVISLRWGGRWFCGASRLASLRAGRKAATPTRMSSSALTAVTIPTWITAASHRSFSGSAGRTGLRRASRHMRST